MQISNASTGSGRWGILSHKKMHRPTIACWV
jgi:hypothetical protein